MIPKLSKPEVKDFIPDFNKWILESTLEFLNRDNDLKARQEEMKLIHDKKGKLNFEDCMKIFNGTFLKTDFLPFIKHPKLIEQNTTYHCGFYAIYNIINIINILLSDDPKMKLKYMHKILNRFSYFSTLFHLFQRFWLFYKRTISQIEAKLKDLGKTSDLSNLLNDCPLERYQMEYLLKNLDKVTKLHTKFSDKIIRFTPIFFSYSFLVPITYEK